MIAPTLTFKNPLRRVRKGEHLVFPRFIGPGWEIGRIKTTRTEYLARRRRDTGEVDVYLKLGGWQAINEGSAFQKEAA